MRHWRDLLRGTPAVPAGAGNALRWVVVDVETSGLDQAQDRLMAIGGVAVHGRRIAIADSIELTLGHPQASARENILLHGIGEEAQRKGMAPKRAIQLFLDYVGTAPLLAFHAGFDRGFLMRAASIWAGVPIGNLWIDVATLARALVPDVEARGLDDWLEHFAITTEQRHTASGDALATAMLFLRLLDAVPARERTPRNLQRIAANARWLGG